MRGAADLPVGLVTAPGDLPVDAVDSAVELCLEGREFPTVPVLSGPSNSLLAQAISFTDGAQVLASGELSVDLNRFKLQLHDDRLKSTAFDALRGTVEVWPAHANSAEAVRGIRVDMIGPVTLALTLGVAGMPRPQAMDAARLLCSELAVELHNTIRSVEPKLTVAVVMAEPRLVGSMHPTFPLTVREVRSLIDPVVDAMDAVAQDPLVGPALIGIHVPGRADWQTIITSGISFLSAPPDPSLVGWSEWVQALLEAGGWIAWGAVPVDRPLGTSEELLWRHLSAVWSDLVGAGVSPSLLGQQCMLSPSGSLSGFAPEQIHGVVALLDAIGERVRTEAIGSRVRIGS